MKTYVKPIMEYVELTVEERFAGSSLAGFDLKCPK